MLNVQGVSVQRGATLTLRDVSLSLAAGRTLAIVGESGAGKSTLIEVILGLLQPFKGTITWFDQPISTCRPALVMQEPRAAFNPRLPLLRSVQEPLIAKQARLDTQRLARLCAGLELSPELLHRRPDAISIGQAQRVGILRALITAPPLVLFDEPLSALDAVTQKRTARLIAALQAEEGFAALIVTHDLGYACAVANDIAVLRTGWIEEMSSAAHFVAAPRSEYGQTLRDAAVALGALEHTA